MSLDLSTNNILLAGVIVALFVVFIFILMKLQPRADSEQAQEPRTEDNKEKPQPLQEPQSIRTLSSFPKPTENANASSKPSVPSTQIPEPATTENQAKLRIQTPKPPRFENRDIPKQNRAVHAPVRAELTASGKECVHFYGYLQSRPENMPIPDECFDCPKLINCLIKPKTLEANLKQ